MYIYIYINLAIWHRTLIKIFKGRPLLYCFESSGPHVCCGFGFGFRLDYCGVWWLKVSKLRDVEVMRREERIRLLNMSNGLCN